MELKNLAKALTAARQEYKRIKKNRTNPGARGAKYATLDAVLAAVETALSKHGVTVFGAPTIITTPTQAGGIETITALETLLVHNETGEFVRSLYPLPDGSDSHKMGAAITYGRRYSICALLNIVADDDDDGNANSKLKYDAQQAATPKPVAVTGAGRITTYGTGKPNA